MYVNTLSAADDDADADDDDDVVGGVRVVGVSLVRERARALGTSVAVRFTWKNCGGGVYTSMFRQ